MLSLAVFASVLAASAAPTQPETAPSTLEIKHVVNVTDFRSIVTKGQQKLAFVNQADSPSNFNSRAVSSGAITNEDISYVAPVIIGGNTWYLAVDTGSSNTWCGVQKACEKTSTGRSTGNSVKVSYGAGNGAPYFSGTQYTDKVSFAGLTVNTQSIGAASKSSGFDGVDGIFGLGPVAQTQGTVANTNQVPTFMDRLYSQGTIPQEVLGVYFKPKTSGTSATNGQLTLGGVDTSKYTGALTYFPTVTAGSASYYWTLSVAKLAYGSTALGSNTQAIIDTGTTLIYIPTSAYNKFLSATGGTTDNNSGLASFNTAPTLNFAFTFGTTTYTLTPSQYLVPQSQYNIYGLTSGKYYSWINDGGSSVISTVLGQKFLENYYSVYDTTNARIGFATAA